MIKNISVFCGSSIGRKDIYRNSAVELGLLLAQQNITMIYGGGNIGMMGIIADTMLENNGYVKGVIPKGLTDKEIAHSGIQEMHVVEDLMERKKMMIAISDAFIILPGGLGTLDEFFEVVTMLQLGYIKKPVGILNIDDYFEDLVRMMNKGVKEQFIKPVHRHNIIVEATACKLFDRITSFEPVENEANWIEHLKKENRYL
ncbi:MAG: TIGR00730 family Rossman fold protein [Bacteroidales bacterium]|nr:TIGR00730 family Rossman fold protein [Bacteroidales bacterium]